MGWTYDEYLEQPNGFVQNLLWLMIEETKAENRRNT
jgi:hypothetical protein